jgi:hypothetical protein
MLSENSFASLDTPKKTATHINNNNNNENKAN